MQAGIDILPITEGNPVSGFAAASSMAAQSPAHTLSKPAKDFNWVCNNGEDGSDRIRFQCLLCMSIHPFQVEITCDQRKYIQKASKTHVTPPPSMKSRKLSSHDAFTCS